MPGESSNEFLKEHYNIENNERPKQMRSHYIVNFRNMKFTGTVLNAKMRDSGDRFFCKQQSSRSLLTRITVWHSIFKEKICVNSENQNLSETPKPKSAKSYLTGSFLSISLKLLSSSRTAFASSSLRVISPSFRATLPE